MEKPTFNNRLNQEYKVDGKTIWNSRSVAVVGVIFGKYAGTTYVLLTRRSDTNTKLDEPGRWCLPSGYLDWDENGWKALIREIYEETSLYIPIYKRYLNIDEKSPFFINTEPNENRQNIALCYALSYNFYDGLPEEIRDYHDKEVDEVKWVPIDESDPAKSIEEYKLAFNHDIRVVQANEHVGNLLYF